MKLTSCFFLKTAILLSIIFSNFYYSSFFAMDHYDNLITSYCNHYKSHAKLNDDESEEYKKHFIKQSMHGGNAFYCLYNNKIKSLKLEDDISDRLFTFCAIICFFYRQGLTENTDPKKNGLYIADFHINDHKNIMHKQLVQEYHQSASKELFYEYEAKFLNKKTVKFYEFFVENSVQKKPLLPWGHQYIRIHHDSEKRKLHVRTMSCAHESRSNVFNYMTDFFYDTRNAPGYKKVHVTQDILENFKNFSSKKNLFLYEIIKTVEKSKKSQVYEDEAKDFIGAINKKYRYPKQLYGNEVYIDSRDLLSIRAHLDYLKIDKVIAKDFVTSIEPFLTLDAIIFEYNNFKKFKIKDIDFSEPEDIHLYVKETVIPARNDFKKLPDFYRKNFNEKASDENLDKKLLACHTNYLNNIVDILELILKIKAPEKNAYLLCTHIFDSNEHEIIKYNLEKEMKICKKRLYPHLEDPKNLENYELKENFNELHNEIITKTKEKNDSELKDKEDDEDEFTGEINKDSYESCNDNDDNK